MARMLDALRRLEATNRLIAPVAPARVEVEAPLDPPVTANTSPPAAREISSPVVVDLDEPPFEPTFGPLVDWAQCDAGQAYASHAIHDALDALDALRDEELDASAPSRHPTTPMAAAPATIAASSSVPAEGVRTSMLDEFDPVAVVEQHERDHEPAVTLVGLGDAPTVAADVLSTIQFAEHWATIALEDFGVTQALEVSPSPLTDDIELASQSVASATAAIEPEVPNHPCATDEPFADGCSTSEACCPATNDAPSPTALAGEATATASAPRAADSLTDEANRPLPSPAEAAAKSDLSRPQLHAQYTALAQRLLHDLTATTKTCAALLSIEHQPHVSDVALRTAMVLCQGGKQVLVIDAALGEKQLTGGLGMAVEFGLSEVLKGRVPWQQAVRATATHGLCVLPAGRLVPPRLADDDRRLKDVLKELTNQWDLVLLDGGSLGESTARHVACAARNVYLVVRLGETNADATEQAVQSLATADVALRGCIVTNGSVFG